MNSVYRDIFRAIHEGKWLSIEYKNEKGEVTRYWIGIKDIHVQKKSLLVEGLHLFRYTCRELYVYIDSILSSSVIHGSHFPESGRLKEDLSIHPDRYQALFHHAANLRILNYYADCNRMDTTPFQCEYSLIRKLDGDSFEGGNDDLNEEQFRTIVDQFQIRGKDSSLNRRIKEICLNVLSIHTKWGLYVLAFRKLNLDVKKRKLVPDEDITICNEFTVDGVKQSVRKFLDADDYFLLEDFEKNAELIKDRITASNREVDGVDDMPYLIAVGRDIIIDLHSEYAGIVDMFAEDRATVPLKAFFGGLVRQPVRKKNYPIALLNSRVNLDQLLAIHNAMKYPLTYIQGPPGTGKTNTIVNTIVTAFFNERTVLFTSYNNHPIDSVCSSLQNVAYKDQRMIPFPIIRLGNNEKTDQALEHMKELYEKTRDIPIFDSTLKKNHIEKVEQTRQLTSLLERHEERLNLNEKKEAIESLLKSNGHLTFQTELEGEQLADVNRQLSDIGEITSGQALRLLEKDEAAFRKYLYYTAAKYIKRLGEPRNKELLDIIYMEDRQARIKEFNRFISEDENMKKFLRIFPIIATTCISAHRLGDPKPYFDMVIMDEASQGNTAVSLIPVIRGETLMLVGDPQQLNPVILLDTKDNEKLRRMYAVSEEYDYIKNSIYKTFLACDSISREILLSHHYRCHRKIISFNNRKYYNNKLIIESKNDSKRPLHYVDVENNITHYKNTAPLEAKRILEYVRQNSGKRIGIITPFTNQKDYINEKLKEEGIGDVTCGTVHAFQGDEKDVVLFSLAITDKTSRKTYNWLKNNRELINVATSRAKDELIVLSNRKELERLHEGADDDIYELVRYVRMNGTCEVTAKTAASRALGIKPYSTETEEAFLENLNHALDNVLNTDKKCVVHKEVGIAHVFQDNTDYNNLFYSGRFDFVVYERDYKKREIPVLAIELDGKEHMLDEVVKERDRKKNQICRDHGFELIRIENSYARRYNYIKEILIRYFKSVTGM